MFSYHPKHLSALAIAASLLTAAHLASAQAPAPFPLVPGEAIATCYSDSNDAGHVAGVFDLRDRSGRPAGEAWTPPVYHGPEDSGAGWTAKNLCAVSSFCDVENNVFVEVFGIALDEAAKPNIYLTATSSYTNHSQLGLNQGNTKGPGEVFKIDGTSGAISLLATLPNSGQGLGNVAYDPLHQQLFVSNFHDGKIYRLGLAGGPPLDAFDPFTPHMAGTPGFAPGSERPWGLAVFEGRLYFGMWEGDPVHSIGIDPGSGRPTGSTRVEIDTTLAGRHPVADLAFGPDGRMLVAERGMNGDTSPTPHNSRLLEFVRDVAGTWQPSPTTFDIGQEGLGSNPDRGENTAGGVDFFCGADGDDFVLATGDALLFPIRAFPGNPRIYGIQMTPATGGTKDNSYLIDLDFEISSADKLDIGDVEAFSRCQAPCLEIVEQRVRCEEDGAFTLEFRFRNLRPETIEHVFGLEPPEGVTLEPSYFNLKGEGVGTDGVWPPMDKDPARITIRGASPGEALTFLLTIHDGTLAECCSFAFTVELPACDCVQVVEQSLACKQLTLPWRTPSVSYEVTLQNLSGQDVRHVLLVPSTPSGVTIQPNHVGVDLDDFEATESIPIHFSGLGSSSSQVCFFAGLHDAAFSQCCATEHCVEPQFCFISPADPFEPIGADLTYFGRELLVEPLPEAEEYGVALSFNGGFGCDIHWRTLDIRDEIAAGATLTARLADGDDAPIGEARITSTESGDFELSADFSDAGARAELYRRGERVAAVTAEHGGDVLVRYPGWPGSAGAALRDGRGTIILGHEDLFVRLPGGDTVVADATVLSADSGGPTTLGALSLVVSPDVPRLVINDVAVVFDCNENGVPDAEDLAAGTSADDNGNGRPDECEPDPSDLIAVLHTGFDQAAGEPLPLGELPAGTVDDEWWVISGAHTGSAKVVADPVAAWPPAFSDSRWISIGTQAQSTGAEEIRYRYCFCLDEGASSVELGLALFADDEARVLLNGTALGEAGGSFNAPAPLAVSHAGQIDDGLFVTGENCLDVDVSDSGQVVTGFVLVGEVRAPGGRCG